MSLCNFKNSEQEKTGERNSLLVESICKKKQKVEEVLKKKIIYKKHLSTSVQWLINQKYESCQK